MKEKYVKAEMEITVFSSEDVITTSTSFVPAALFIDDDGNIVDANGNILE